MSQRIVGMILWGSVTYFWVKLDGGPQWASAGFAAVAMAPWAVSLLYAPRRKA